MEINKSSKANVLLLIGLALLLIKVDIGKSQYANTSESNENYKILMIAAVGTRSHKNFYMGIVTALAARNHEVTVISTFREPKNISNVKDIVLSGPNMNILVSDPFKNGQMSMAFQLISKPAIHCSHYLAMKEVQDLRNEKFDLIMISPWGLNDCFFSLIHHFKVPYVFVSPNILISGMHQMAGSIYFEALAPTPFLKTSQPPTYFDRLLSTIFNIFCELLLNHYTLPRLQKYCDEAGLCNDVPNLADFYGKNNLVIINSVKSLDQQAQPWMPHVIHAGGIHCREANQLSKELEEWIQDSGEAGFILFSLGSSVTPSSMPKKYRDIFLAVFGSLNYKVLWKWDEEIIDGLPSNVKISKWLPQQDILGHEKIRLFITHGGLLSLLEATYHNVPVLGMPLFIDQFYNIRNVLAEGWGAKLDWTDLSEDLLLSTILSVAESNEKRNIVRKRSNLMRDRLNQPSDEVTYWIEYVIRHNGAEHMKSPFGNFYIWQLYNIDVWILLIVTWILITALFLLCLKKFITKVFCRKYKTE